jgi:hypothetical protein
VLSAASTGHGGSVALGFVFIFLGIVAYWTPLPVVWLRHVPHIGSIAVINGFLGWTVVGWVIALAMACRSRPPAVTMLPPTGSPGRASRPASSFRHRVLALGNPGGVTDCLRRTGIR